MPERRISVVPGPDGETVAEDLDFTVVEEGAGRYNLADGTKLRARLVARKISRVLTKDGKTIQYSTDGEPVYFVRYQVVLTAEVPESLMKPHFSTEG